MCEVAIPCCDMRGGPTDRVRSLCKCHARYGVGCRAVPHAWLPACRLVCLSTLLLSHIEMQVKAMYSAADAANITAAELVKKGGDALSDFLGKYPNEAERIQEEIMNVTLLGEDNNAVYVKSMDSATDATNITAAELVKKGGDALSDFLVKYPNEAERIQEELMSVNLLGNDDK